MSPLEYQLNRPFEEVTEEIQRGLQKMNIGIFPETFKFGHLELSFIYCDRFERPSPYRASFNESNKKLAINYNIASGSLLGAEFYPEKIVLPPKTRIITFDLDNATLIDKLTGKMLKDLTGDELIFHFRPDLRFNKF